VEIGAAVKNIIAIAAGVGRTGFRFQRDCGTDHSRTRRIGSPSHAADAGKRCRLAGLGDLVLTSYGQLSRNRRVGVALGQGRKIDEITASMLMVAEGVKTTKSTVDLAQKLNVEMPIVKKMYSVLYEGLDPQDAIDDLMERKLKEE
jgi:glycerol-3-phosphate dehydrogenase (NAD(P)+)